MSAASISSSSPDLYTILQQLNGQSQTQNTAAPTATAATAAAAPADGASAAGGASKHHHGHHGVPEQIESAVTDALQNAPDGSDPNQTIQTAIQNALKQAAGGQQNGADPASAGNSPAGSSTSSSGSTQSAGDFNSLLQSFGVDPKQFQQDFQSAVQNVNQSGSVDFASLFRSFPPGSAVNTVA